jgi:Spy/CpxP family protein refolding chaperone
LRVRNFPLASASDPDIAAVESAAEYNTNNNQTKFMKMKKMLIAALTAGTLLACSLPLLAQDAPTPPPGGAPGGGRRGGPMTSDALIARFQTALGDTNKLSDDIIAKVKPVLDDMIKKQTDLRADQTLSPEDRTTKRTAIMTEASDALKAIVTPAQFAIIQPLLQQAGRGGRRGGAGGAPPPPAAPPQ